MLAPPALYMKGDQLAIFPELYSSLFVVRIGAGY